MTDRGRTGVMDEWMVVVVMVVQRTGTAKQSWVDVCRGGVLVAGMRVNSDRG